ncbi:MAG TPA: VOC family protein [Pseudonocardiaceae bacterium]|nr:VOC family protein [Pseudonocardiaceae bacterium]
MPPSSHDKTGEKGVSDGVARVGGVTYLRIPAADPQRSAAFYQAVFGWTLGGTPENPSFADGTGHVIGHWRTDLAPVGEAGVLPYVFVRSVDETLRLIIESGGEIATAPYPEGDLWVATFRDPAGNVIGVWHGGPRG